MPCGPASVLLWPKGCAWRRPRLSRGNSPTTILNFSDGARCRQLGQVGFGGVYQRLQLGSGLCCSEFVKLRVKYLSICSICSWVKCSPSNFGIALLMTGTSLTAALGSAMGGRTSAAIEAKNAGNRKARAQACNHKAKVPRGKPYSPFHKISNSTAAYRNPRGNSPMQRLTPHSRPSNATNPPRRVQRSKSQLCRRAAACPETSDIPR